MSRLLQLVEDAVLRMYRAGRRRTHSSVSGMQRMVACVTTHDAAGHCQRALLGQWPEGSAVQPLRHGTVGLHGRCGGTRALGQQRLCGGSRHWRRRLPRTRARASPRRLRTRACACRRPAAALAALVSKGRTAGAAAQCQGTRTGRQAACAAAAMRLAGAAWRTPRTLFRRRALRRLRRRNVERRGPACRCGPCSSIFEGWVPWCACERGSGRLFKAAG